MSLYGMLAGKGPSGFGYASTAEEVAAGRDLAGKRFLVTGSTSGIGMETARVLLARGATVVATARTAAKAAEALGPLGGALEPLACELSEPASVRACVAAVRAGAPLDGIVANAGIMALPRLEQKHGYELQFFTNHVGHFLLVTGLMDHLSEDARVVMVSSAAHRAAPSGGIEFDNLSGARGYSAWRAYGQSKLANLLFARALARRWEGTARVANAVHPGVIHTNLGRHMPAIANLGYLLGNPLFLKSIPEGAATQTWAAVHPGAAALRGEYLADCNVAASTALGRDDALAERLWTESERIAGTLPG